MYVFFTVFLLQKNRNCSIVHYFCRILTINEPAKNGQPAKVRKILQTDRSYPAFTQQVISTQNKWQDIKPATDISSLKMTELKFRAR